MVLGGCGSAVLAATFPGVGIGLLGGRTGLRPDGTDHGHRSHQRLPSNPAVSVGLWAGGRFAANELLP